jgi:hypothetical protein
VFLSSNWCSSLQVFIQNTMKSTLSDFIKHFGVQYWKSSFKNNEIDTKCFYQTLGVKYSTSSLRIESCA